MHCSLLANFWLSPQYPEWSRAFFLGLLHLSEDLSYCCLLSPCMPSFPQGNLAPFLSCGSLGRKCPSSIQLHAFCFFLTNVYSSFKSQPKASPMGFRLHSVRPSSYLGICFPKCPSASISLSLRPTQPLKSPAS